MATLHASRFTLHASRFTLHASRFKGLRSAALIGVASLSLAACGGGESTDPARRSRLDEREKELGKKEATVSQTAKEQAARKVALDRREAAAEEAERDPELKAILDARQRELAAKEAELQKKESSTMGFADFSITESGNISNIVNEVEGTSIIINLVAMSNQEGDRTPTHRTRRLTETRVIRVTPTINSSGKFGNYTLDFHNAGALSDSTRSGDNTFNYHSYGKRTRTLSKVFGFNQDSYTATNLDLGLGDNFDSKTLKAEVDTNTDNVKDAKIRVEVTTGYPKVSDYTGEDRTRKWIVYGYWLQVPKDTLSFNDYNFGAFSDIHQRYATIPVGATGTATYEGGMLGLHTSLKDNEVKLSRFTGKAIINADFGDASARGNLKATFSELKLDGKSVGGRITFSEDFNAATVRAGSLKASNINGISYTGEHSFIASGQQYTDPRFRPTGFTGTLKGKSSDGNSKFVAGFGAVQAE